jgi:cysteine desulfurase
MSNPRIYFDHAASSPLRPEARAAMEAYFGAGWANPSSIHWEGRQAKEALDLAREQVTSRLGCLFGEIQFTSSGTEAANAALVGVALANADPSRRRILLGAAEHHCVLYTKPILERLGYEVELIAATPTGGVDLDDLDRKLRDDVLIASVMHANNETGAINDISSATQMAADLGVLTHVDAVQTFGVLDFSVDSLGADLLNVSAHKIGGPLGVGALYVRSGVEIKPLLVGGAQEREARAGTENVAGILGFGAASATIVHPAEYASIKSQARDAFLQKLKDELGPIVVETLSVGNGLPGHAHVRFTGVIAETLLIRLDRVGVSVSTGAACSSGSLEPSHVLVASGWSMEETQEAVRFTFGWSSTVEEAVEGARRVATEVKLMAGKAV